MGELPHHGQIDFPATLVAGDRQRPQSRPVITLRAAQDLAALRLSDLYLILARQLQCSFNRFGAAGCKEDRTVTVVLAREFQQFVRVLFGYGSSELAAMNKLQVRGLLHHGVRDLAHPMTVEVDRRRAGEIQISLACGIPHVNAFPAHSWRK